MDEVTMFIGLDLHKATIAEGGRREAARYFGEIENTPAALGKLARKYGRANTRLSFCYEAGPCDYGVHRQLTSLGQGCLVVAPSLIPKRAGDRVKTDRRGAEGGLVCQDPATCEAVPGEGEGRQMQCIACEATAVMERPEHTAQGYRRFRCCAKTIASDLAAAAAPRLPGFDPVLPVAGRCGRC